MSFEETRQTEIVACNICGTKEGEHRLFPINSGYLVQCTNCELYYATPRFIDIIKDLIEDRTPEELYDPKKLNYKGRIREFNDYLNAIEPMKQPPAMLLDIGCYEGYFLYEAQKKGWLAHGVEPNRGGAAFAQEKLGLDVKQCILEKAEYPANSFDVITLLASLEHVPDPSAVLFEIRRIIRDDGLLVLSVPTIPFYLGLVGPRWRMFIGDHYYFFTDLSMKKLLDKNGFKLIRKRFIKKHFDLDTVTARLSDDWQPNNLGAAGRVLRAFVQKLHLESLNFSVCPFDSKIYFAVPV
jgi:SAM-dependent methyltransferase